MNQEKDQLAELQEANAKLRASLKQCREMVADYRSRIAANVNDPDERGDGVADPRPPAARWACNHWQAGGAPRLSQSE